jgi:MFS family permease
MVGNEHKGIYLGICIFFAAGVSAIFGPIFGLLSDKFGHRKIWIFCGIIFNCVGLFIMGMFSNVYVFIFGYFFAALSVTASAAPFVGFVADNVPKEKIGSTSGVLSSMGFLGTLVGSSFGFLISYSKDTSVGFSLLMIIMLCGMLVTVLVIPERKLEQEKETRKFTDYLKSFIEPFMNSKDFRWTLISQFFFQLGIDSIRSFLQYYLRDTLKYPFMFVGVWKINDEASALSIILISIAIISLLSSITVGKLSEFYGFLGVFVCVSGLYLASFPFMLITMKGNYYIYLIFSILFGIGQGSYTAISWGLAIKSIPEDSKSNGQSLAMWQTTRIAATLISGNNFFPTFSKEPFQDLLISSQNMEKNYSILITLVTISFFQSLFSIFSSGLFPFG